LGVLKNCGKNGLSSIIVGKALPWVWSKTIPKNVLGKAFGMVKKRLTELWVC
jgi:hypothetical protein